MRTYHILYIQLLLICSLLTACFKDKGSYEYIDYNEITISSITGKTTISLGEALDLKPQLKWKSPNKDTLNFNFEWVFENKVVSNKRNIDYTPTQVGGHWYYLFVKDNNDNIVYRKEIFLTINSAYNAGWVILSEKNNNSSLSYIRREKYKDEDKKDKLRWVPFVDIYQQLHPDAPLGNNPSKIVTKIFPTDEGDELLIIQGNKQSVFLSGSDFSKISYLADEFKGGQIPDNQDIKDYHFYKTTAHVVLSDGSIYWKRYQSNSNVIHTGTFFSSPLRTDDIIKTHQFVEAKSYETRMLPLFDYKQNRLVHINMSNSVSLSNGRFMENAYRTTLPSDFIKLDEMAEVDYIYGAEYAKGESFMNLLRHKASNEYIIQEYNIFGVTSPLNISEIKQYKLPNPGIITETSIFYRMRKSSYMFISSGSKVYFYDFNTTSFKLYYDFGSPIVDLKSGGDESEFAVASADGTLYICSPKDPILALPIPGSEGIMSKIENLGRVVSIAFKYGDDTAHYFDQYN
ncbi:PKD-like family lipoprotein [Sphingobacterium faecale]|uniref:PKD family protein n=1 Tax=Sphingobacterium faecale TaxID=2803775 RepID=A0ABS1QY46_9SPHI|nr:PKD-like family lipoprotein [Sphingobacterium faecale]MBL1407356.1 hypothetical protein [Sphingobacterium faecale]